MRTMMVESFFMTIYKNTGKHNLSYISYVSKKKRKESDGKRWIFAIIFVIKNEKKILSMEEE